jgi:hypothetical protein
MQLQRNEPAIDRLFSVADEETLRVDLADRIANHSRTNSLLNGLPLDAVRLLMIWRDAKGSPPVQDHVGSVLVTNPQPALSLIQPFSSFARTRRVGIDQTEYDELITIARPEDLMRAFEQLGLLAPAKAEGVARLAQDFAAIYQRTQAEPLPEEPQR